uniref:tRNA:m(4)X modification enzyme TRM13 n=2 Tax=Nothobranchius kuhntae TaxID=321403 RepID=A0A1A8JFW3_NOTKU
MAEPTRCVFFLQKKKRFCKMIVAKGRRFCGEHATMEEGGSSRRITCPLDPKHTVTKDKLEKHLKRCNSREKPKPVYYVENINAGPVHEDQELPQVTLSEHSKAELEALVDKLKAAVEGLESEVEDRILSHSVLQDQLINPKNGESAHKHLKQQASILGHLEELNLLYGQRCFVEFGAGRGKLSHWIHEALRTHEDPKAREDLQLLLVERCSTRFKVDGKHQDAGLEFERLQVDIQHLDLSRVPLLQQKQLPLVGVGKHVCGAATDLALRCLLGTAGAGDETRPASKRSKPADEAIQDPSLTPWPRPLLGLAVALCCHHRCEWRHYVGQEFFQQKGLGPAEFSSFCRMSSWATCGLRPANQEPPSQSPSNQRGEDDVHQPVEETDAVSSFLTAGKRQQLGRLCKLLIDGGRCHFLQTRGLSTKLIGYVDTGVTLENVLLTAVPSES